MNRSQQIVLGVFLFGAGLGYLTGNIAGRKAVRKAADAEIESVVKEFRELRHSGYVPKEYSDRQEAKAAELKEQLDNATEALAGSDVEGREAFAARLAEMKDRLEGKNPLIDPPTDEPPVTVVNNVFVNSKEVEAELTDEDRDFAWRKMVDARTDDKPFVIEMDEYYLEQDYEKVTIYFFADNTLTTESYQQIDDPEQVVGLANLVHFGLKSGEDNIVYIRNRRRETDYEVVRQDETFAQTVHQIDDESDPQPNVPRFRPGSE